MQHRHPTVGLTLVSTRPRALLYFRLACLAVSGLMDTSLVTEEQLSVRGETCPVDRLAGPFDLAVLCQLLDEERMMQLTESLGELNPGIRSPW